MLDSIMGWNWNTIFLGVIAFYSVMNNWAINRNGDRIRWALDHIEEHFIPEGGNLLDYHSIYDKLYEIKDEVKRLNQQGNINIIRDKLVEIRLSIGNIERRG
jgi:hypothetical protein